MTRWTYNADHRKRPNVHPLAAPSGAVLTCDAPDDHPWHHGLVVHDQVRQRGELLGGDGALRRAPPCRPDDRALDPARSRDRRDRRPAIDRGGRPRCRRRVRDRLDDRARPACRRPARPHTVHHLGRLRRARARGAGPTGPTPGSSSPTARCTIACSACRPSGATCRAPSTERPRACCSCTAPQNPRHPVPWYGSTKAATYGDEGWSNFVNAAFLWDEPLAGRGRRGADVLVTASSSTTGSGRTDRCAAEWDRWTLTDRRTAAAGPPFPGGIGVSHLRVYDTPAPDGLAGGTPHLHTVCTEAYAVIAGSGEVHTLTASGFRVTPLEPGAFVWFTAGTIHRLVNGGGLEILVLMANAGLPEAGDLVITFPPEIVADAERVRDGRDACRDDDRTTAGPGVSARQRRDLAVPTFLELVAATERGDPAAVADVPCGGGRARPAPARRLREAVARRPGRCGRAHRSSSWRRWRADRPSTWRPRPCTRCPCPTPSAASAVAGRSARMSTLAEQRHRVGRRARGTRRAGCCGIPPGSFDDYGLPPRSAHMVPQSAWYAVGLLARGDTGTRRTRARRAVRVAVRPAGTRYGTGPSPGSPSGPNRPRRGAVEWVDYDPNWRQFLGTTFAVILETFDVSPQTPRRACVRRSIVPSPASRVTEWRRATRTSRS